MHIVFRIVLVLFLVSAMLCNLGSNYFHYQSVSPFLSIAAKFKLLDLMSVSYDFKYHSTLILLQLAAALEDSVACFCIYPVMIKRAKLDGECYKLLFIGFRSFSAM